MNVHISLHNCKILSLHYSLVSIAAGVSSSVLVTKSSTVRAQCYSALASISFHCTRNADHSDSSYFSNVQKTFSLNYSQRIFASVEAH